MSADDVIPPSPQHRDEEVLHHVLKEVRAGRTLDDVLQDPYVEERREPGTHDKVLDHPEVAEVVGAEIIAQMRQMLDTQTGGSAHPPAGDQTVSDSIADEMRRVSGDD